ncbi:MAG: YIP1 family protein [Pyrinomonadaceae bacterium]
MQEENSINEPNLPVEQDSSEWQAPPPPEKIIAPEPPQMSEAATLGSIFFEPGNTFEDLRRKPRFIMALLVIIILTTAFSFAFYYKVGESNFKRFVAEQIDKNPQTQGLTGEQKEGAIQLNMTIGKVVRFAMPVIIILVTAFGGLLYWLGGKAFGGSGGYLHGVSIWVYASLPPLVVSMIANFIILFLKSVDDIDIGTASQRGLVNANPSFLLDGKSMPVLATLVGTLDLFMIWGWVLAAIGLRIVYKISSGSAWAIVIILALIQIAFRVVGALMSGNAT